MQSTHKRPIPRANPKSNLKKLEKNEVLLGFEPTSMGLRRRRPDHYVDRAFSIL
jgi:hypothetical protein